MKPCLQIKVDLVSIQFLADRSLIKLDSWICNHDVQAEINFPGSNPNLSDIKQNFII